MKQRTTRIIGKNLIEKLFTLDHRFHSNRETGALLKEFGIFCDFKLEITWRIGIILMEHIDIICSLDNSLQLTYICFIRNLPQKTPKKGSWPRQPGQFRPFSTLRLSSFCRRLFKWWLRRRWSRRNITGDFGRLFILLDQVYRVPDALSHWYEQGILWFRIKIFLKIK